MQRVSYSDQGELVNLASFSRYHQNLLRAWWEEWQEQSFPQLLPFHGSKHALEHKDLEVGDICMLKHSNKVSRH